MLKDLRIAVLGAGTMGMNIAQLFAKYGYSVTLYNRTAANIEKALKQIDSNLKVEASLGEIEESDIPAIKARISTTSDMKAAVENADFITENLAEVKEVKIDAYAKLNEWCRKDAIITSNTSTMGSIFEFAPLDDKSRFCICHFFLPASAIALVELVKGPDTNEATVETVKALMESIKKNVAVLNKPIAGFIVNRITEAVFREANYIAEQGVASPEDIDKAIVSVYGPRYAFEGPFALADFAGVDFYEKFSDLLFPELGTAKEAPKAVRDLVAEGNFGIKTGKGFYEYEGDLANWGSIRSAKITKMKQAIDKTMSEFNK